MKFLAVYTLYYRCQDTNSRYQVDSSHSLRLEVEQAAEQKHRHHIRSTGLLEAWNNPKGRAYT